MSDNGENVHIVQAETMRRFCIAACKEAQLSQEHAELVADVVIQADLRGVDSHGVTRFPHYIEGYKRGSINPDPSIKLVVESGATAVITWSSRITSARKAPGSWRKPAASILLFSIEPPGVTSSSRVYSFGSATISSNPFRDGRSRARTTR